MQTPTIRYRFIPFRKTDIVQMCLQEDRLAGKESEFKQLCQMLSSVFHFEFHKLVESLKDNYAPIDPDADTRNINSDTPSIERDFVEELNVLLEKANYERVSEEELNSALTEASLFRIRLHVDFDEFSEVLLFCRGVSQRQETLSSFFGLYKKTIDFTNYDRVVLYLRFRDDLKPSKAQQSIPKPGTTLLRLFQNVPRADLEMLFPNTAVRMRLIDKLVIGIPAAISGGIVFTTKLGASLVLVGSLLGFWLGMSSEPVELNEGTLLALMAGIAALGGYLWKQFNSFKNRKMRFMQALTQSLYFKNLDNNAGVFHRLANDAEEEENKEAVLAYYFLLENSQAMKKEDLDKKIEHWLSDKWQCQVDFEIDDALEKLMTLNLVTEADGEYRAVSIQQGIKNLDQRWDDYYQA
ncbi:MAG: hypothetical protein ACI9FB_002628 [Candidatus Azotimanducaceae bacterium]|jgi:hypothetical protein